MKKKILSLLLSIFASIGVALADECGVCGNNLQWSYNNTTHALTIAGSGAMWNWSSISSVPWHSYRSEITSVSLPNGLTSICDYAFYGCTALTSGTINTISGIDCDFFPEIGPTAGAVTLVVKFDVAPCEGYYIAFAGKYKDHNWCGEGDGETFTDIGNGWYKVVLYPDEDGNLIGRPCMANSPDQRWLHYHWTADIVNLQGLEDAVMQINDFGQLNLDFGTLYNGEVIYVEATGWTWSPCRTYLPAEADLVETVTWPATNSQLRIRNVSDYADDYLVYSNSNTSETQSLASLFTAIGSISIPESVTSIGENAFYGCTGLTSITIPNSMTSIGSNAFDGCTRLTRVTWNAVNYPNFSNYNNNPFYSLRSQITSFTIGNDVQSIPSFLCYGMSNLTSITIPNSVTSIGSNAFYGCTSLTSVTIGNHVTNIASNAFYDCSLTSIIWNVRQFSDFASTETSPFYVIREQLNSFEFGEEVEKIPAYLCYGMSNLTSVSLPASVKNIGNNAFADCSALENIYSYRTLPPNAYSTAFDGVDKFACVLHVPSESIDYYKNAAAWRDFFYVTILGAETAEVTALTITPHEDNADVMWPAVVNAYSYEFTITDSNGNTVCTLTFNANGQLTGLILHAPAAEGLMQRATAGTGFSFNVTGLENGNTYSLVIKAKDSNGTVLQTFSQDFTTGTTALENVNADDASGVRKVIEDGRVIILMPDGRKFDASGKLLK